MSYSKTGLQIKPAVYVVRVSIAGKQRFFGEYTDKDTAELCFAEAMRIKAAAESAANKVTDAGMADMRNAGFMHPRAAKNKGASPISQIAREPIFPTTEELRAQFQTELY